VNSGYGNVGILLEQECRKQPCLRRLRPAKNVQRLEAQQFARDEWSRRDNQDCQTQTMEARLQLQSWSTKRQVVHRASAHPRRHRARCDASTASN
jgi:hypothetical protein